MRDAPSTPGTHTRTRRHARTHVPTLHVPDRPTLTTLPACLPSACCCLPATACHCLPLPACPPRPNHLHAVAPTADVDLSTDDLLDIIVYVIVQAHPNSETLLVHLKYIQRFHFVNSNTSILGYAPPPTTTHTHTHTRAHSQPHLC